MNPDGTNQVALTSGGNDAYPAWSPDGRAMAFTRFGTDGDADIFTIRSDGTNLTRLTSGPPSEFAPAWSPNGQTLAFAKVQAGGKTDIFSMPAAGGPAVNLTNTLFDAERAPSWSPDGSEIAYEADIESTRDIAIFVIDSDGTDRRQVSQPPYPLSDHHPDWSPDGTRLVFWRHHCTHSCTRSGGQILVVGAGGGGEQAVTPPFSNSEDPVWSPDATRIAFTKTVGDELTPNDQIFTMASDGTDQQQLTSEPAPPFGSPPSNISPTWQAPPPPFERPASAGSARVSLVPDFRQTISATQCAARGGQGSTHGAPLAFFSCDPPFFLPGPAAFFGSASSSWVQYTVVPGDTNTSNGDQADVALHASLSDIQGSDGSDYQAGVTLATKLRITDRFNGGSQTGPATVADFDYSTPIACGATVGPEGASCNLDTSADATTAGTVKENKATVMQVFRFRVNDSGANGVRGDSDDRTFAMQGIYIP